ncbi:MAG: zinc-binding dehydrogenase [Anaerolineales bacterium]
MHGSGWPDLEGTSFTGSKKVKMGSAPAKVENLVTLKKLVEAGHLKTVVGRRYPLEQIAEAFRYIESGHKTGNVIITVDHDHRT